MTAAGLTLMVAGPAVTTWGGAPAPAIPAAATGPALTGPESERLPPEVLARLTRLLIDGLHAPARETRADTLLGLARLRDPSLQPLFSLLACTGPMEDRGNATVALATLEPQRGVDGLLLRHLSDDLQRAGVLVRCIERDLISLEQLLEIAHWPDLGERSTILVAAYLSGRDDAQSATPATEATPGNGVGAPRRQDVVPVLPTAKGVAAATPLLRQLAESQDVGLAAAAAAVLAQQGEATGLERLSRLTPKLATTRYEGPARGLVGLIGSAKMNLLGDWCLILAAQPGISPTLAEAAVAGAARSGSRSVAVRNAVLGVARRMASGDGVPAGTRGELAVWLLEAALTEPLRLDDNQWEVLGKQVAAGREAGLCNATMEVMQQLSTGAAGSVKAVERLLAAVDDTVPPATALAVARWALAWAAQRPFQEAQAAREGILGMVLRLDQADLIEPAAIAARMLTDADPVRTAALLTGQGKGQRLHTAALLLGALASSNPEASGVAMAAAGTLRPSDILAELCVLVEARHPIQGRPRPSAARLAALALGEGDGQLTLPVRMQAAWLAVRGSGHEKATLARILSPR